MTDHGWILLPVIDKKLFENLINIAADDGSCSDILPNFLSMNAARQTAASRYCKFQTKI